ncbi:hypothetical protein F8M41_000852 [Gigaspora margarita]|uniref:Uncharacterized protein n=1 Tax=Gigaspora margarita TaxID=4874 RepID=A0A8H4A9Q6_GIGMA|nr:hypothetical protein F8M41_000852 [Gigaspora margarita]
MAYWRSYKIRDNLSLRHLRLPGFHLADESLPFQIGMNISVKEYNDFLDTNESSGYKFHYDKKNVYIIAMASSQGVISYIQECFKKPNNRVIRSPIMVSGQPFHNNPIGIGEKIAPDTAVRPREWFVQRANAYPYFPRGDFTGNSHARIICEVASTQKIELWNTKCETWMHEEYVRCVFGLKIYPKINIQGIVHQSIIVSLYV